MKNQLLKNETKGDILLSSTRDDATRLNSAIQNYLILHYLFKIVCKTQTFNIYINDIRK